MGGLLKKTGKWLWNHPGVTLAGTGGLATGYLGGEILHKTFPHKIDNLYGTTGELAVGLKSGIKTSNFSYMS